MVAQVENGPGVMDFDPRLIYHDSVIVQPPPRTQEQMNLYVGTSGYSYKEWTPAFYPKHEEEGKAPQMARRFLELAS